MNKKRLFAILMCGLMTLSVISCGGNTDNQKKDDGKKDNKPEEETEIKYEEDLVEADYEGYTFRIYIRPQKTPDQYVPEETGDTIDDAVYKRNQMVAERFNIQFAVTESPSSDYETGALNTILAGDDAYDVIFPHSRAAFSYALQGALMNWKEIPNVDLKKPWWAKDIQTSSTINGKLYVMDGDISLHSLSFASCLAFNKKLFDELGLDYPYQMVKDGKWTFDEFEKLVKQGTKDLNGDNVIKPEDDRLGYFASEWSGPITILYAGGQRIYTTSKKGIPELTLNNERTVEIYDKYFGLLNTDDAFVKLSGALANYTGNDAFRNDRALFSDSSLGSVKGLRDMESDFGIVPYPKFQEDADYHTIVNGHAHLVVVPTTAYSHIDKTGAILEALCAYGSRDVVPAFYDVSLQTKFARDDESSEMMDIIRANRVYDLGYLSGGTFQSTGYELARSSSPDFSSYYAEKESAALTKLDEFITQYGK